MNSISNLRAALAAVALATVSAAAHAVPVWDEGFDGDLSSGSLPGTDLGLLTAVNNDINGSLDGGTAADGSGGDEHDVFKFTVASAWGLDVNFLDAVGTAGLVIFHWDENFNSIGAEHVYTPDIDIWTGGAGTWVMSLTPEGNTGQVAYSVSIYVPDATGVPEPLGAALIGLGLLGLAAGRRSR